jgi:fibronectin type 3 domain-containing protein
VKIGRTPEYTPRRPLLRPDPRETPVPAPDAKKVEEPSATPEVTGSNKPEPEASSSSPVLRVEGSGPEGVRLAWTASPGVRRFALLRSDSKDGEYKLVRAGEGAFAYVDRTAEAGKTYWYKIRTIGRSADESDSEPVSATVEQSADTPRERFRRR